MQRKEPNMAASRFVLSLAVAISGSVMFQTAVSAQEGTDAQRMACTPDVFRLCGSEIPDHDRIVSCLRHNVTLLSRPCRAVFDPNFAAQQSAPAPDPRGRTMQQQPSYGYGAQQPYQRYQPYQNDDDDDDQ
jgi:hypothetical protein